MTRSRSGWKGWTFDSMASLLALAHCAPRGSSPGGPEGPDPVGATAAPYAWAADWPVLAPDFVLGETSGVGVDSHGHVFLFHRGDGPSILGLEPSDGRVVVRFGEGLFENPHGLAIGPNDEVGVTDTLRHPVLRFSHDGALLQNLGERGVAGDDLAHFDQPTDLAFASTGEIDVGEGDGNDRVVRLSASGQRAAALATSPRCSRGNHRTSASRMPNLARGDATMGRGAACEPGTPWRALHPASH